MRTHRIAAGLALWPLLSAAGSAQTTILTEDFSSGLVPPAGWTEIDLGTAGSNGWEPDPLLALGSDAAWHDDYTGLNDAHLMSPAMDLSGVTEAYCHAQQFITFGSWRDHHYVDVSLDNGVTFVNVLDDLSPDGQHDLEADLSAYAGTNGVNVSFHYTGDFASEWRVDDVVVDDVAPPPPPPVWPNLPTTFVTAEGYAEDFEALAGVVPSHMAVNGLDDLNSTTDPEAWCNIGQQGLPGTGGNGNVVPPHQGAYCLEMGLDPSSINYHKVRNGLILGLNGAGNTLLWMNLWAIDHGDETDPWDGIWVSDDGVNWTSVFSDWNVSIGDLVWEEIRNVDLSATGLTNGDFYLLISQTDNFPMGYLDGVQVDELSFFEPGSTLAVSNLVAGQDATVTVTDATPGAAIGIAYSLTGSGPTNVNAGGCGVVSVDLSDPISLLPLQVADAAGSVTLIQPVPAGTVGLVVDLQALDLSTCVASNSLSLTIG